jgi:hypothetical protein
MPSELAAYKAVGTLYNALMTAVVLSLVTRRGEDTAREYVFRHFRRQHLEKFLPGLQKLGLRGERDAPACALYHYHSNALGGVKTGYLRESDSKAWVRYPPPRWIWKGTAIAAVPHSVSAAMLHGWHGHNGVSLGNDRLGFVCTGMTVDGLPGLEGYYIDYGRKISESDRVRFAYGTEEMPRVDWKTQPKLDTDSWPEERKLKTFRAYALEYHAADPAGPSGHRGHARRTGPGRPPRWPAIPRGDSARDGTADRRRTRRSAKRARLRQMVDRGADRQRRTGREDRVR